MVLSDFWQNDSYKKDNFPLIYDFCLCIELIYNLGDKTNLYLIFNRINGFVGV